MNNFAKSENDARKSDIAAINSRIDKENSERNLEDKALNERIDREISDRENAINQVYCLSITWPVSFGKLFDRKKKFQKNWNLFCDLVT